MRTIIIKGILATDMSTVCLSSYPLLYDLSFLLCLSPQHFDELKKLDLVEAKGSKPASSTSVVTSSGSGSGSQVNSNSGNAQSSGAGGQGSNSKGQVGHLVTPPSPHNSNKADNKIRQLPPSAAFSPTSPQDRQFVVNVLIHSADLSGQVFPTVIAKDWEERIAREFSAQAEVEKKMDIPVAPFMQNLNDPYTRAKLQVNFIDFVLSPWWKGVARVWPGE